MIKIIPILLLTLLCSCSSDSFMRKEFSGTKILIDEETGARYIIKHSFGDNYSVRPLSSSALYKALQAKVDQTISVTEE